MNNYFFSYEMPGIFAKFPRQILPYIQLSRPYHFAGGVIPCLMGFHFASVQHDVLKWYTLFIIGAFAILGAGATLNDIIDEKIDKSYYRSMARPIPSGRICVLSAIMYFVLQLFIAFFVWLQLPDVVKIMTLVEFALVAIYPFMKRIMNFTQFYLGFIVGLPVLFSYCLFEEKLTLSAIFLSIAISVHCVIFDTFFEYSEYFHNKDMRAKSIVFLVGKNSKLFFYILSIFCLICLLSAGHLSDKSLIYYISCLSTILFMIVKIYLTDIYNQEQCLKTFLSIQLSSIFILIGIILSAYIK